MNLFTPPSLIQFVKTFCEMEEVWMIFDNDGMLVSSIDENGNPVVPVFIDKKLAQPLLDQSDDLKIEGVMIDEFLFGLIPSLIESQINLSVYPFDGEVVDNCFTPRSLAKQLKLELEEAYGERVNLPY